MFCVLGYCACSMALALVMHVRVLTVAAHQKKHKFLGAFADTFIYNTLASHFASQVMKKHFYGEKNRERKGNDQ